MNNLIKGLKVPGVNLAYNYFKKGHFYSVIKQNKKFIDIKIWMLAEVKYLSKVADLVRPIAPNPTPTARP